MTSFIIALQFLTRLPLNINIQWTDEKVALSLPWYPLVGAVIGLCLIVVAKLFNAQDPLLIAAIILSFWVLITGALHLDGLADSADAWMGSHGNKERALDIMKDPQAGPVAVVVLILLLLIKFSAITSLNLQNDMYLLLVPPVVARCVPLLLFLTTPYVRKNGLGSAMAEYLPVKQAWLVLACVLVCGIALLGITQVVLLIIFVGCVFWFLRYLMLKLIKGMTGDTIGAAIEIIEVVVLLTLVAR